MTISKDETAKTAYPIVNTFSFPILSANIPEGIPITVCEMLITAYTNGMTFLFIPKLDAFSKIKE
jgi:hypothetical protein